MHAWEWVILAVVVLGIVIAVFGWDRYRGNRKNAGTGSGSEPTSEAGGDVPDLGAATLRWVAQTVHQAYHQEVSGTWETCPRDVCASIRNKLDESAALSPPPEPVSAVFTQEEIDRAKIEAAKTAKLLGWDEPASAALGKEPGDG